MNIIHIYLCLSHPLRKKSQCSELFEVLQSPGTIERCGELKLARNLLCTGGLAHLITQCVLQFPPSEALLTIHRTSETLQPPTATDMSDKFNQSGDTKLQEHGIY